LTKKPEGGAMGKPDPERRRNEGNGKRSKNFTNKLQERGGQVTRGEEEGETERSLGTKPELRVKGKERGRLNMRDEAKEGRRYPYRGLKKKTERQRSEKKRII